MEESKYYTPALEDLFIGYECEFFADMDEFGDPDTWHYGTIQGWELPIAAKDGTDSYRTPYLTKEQIEAEGWKYLDWSLSRIFEKDFWFVDYDFEDHELEIYKDVGERYEYIFKGKCPSINEFRKIIKLLDI